MTLQKFWKEWRGTLILLFAILFTSFTLRIINLTHLPVFGDEAIYIRWAQIMRTDASLRFVPLSDGKQPLFMWVVILFTKFFQDPLIAGRFVSVLTGTATSLGVFILTHILFENKKQALVASLLYSLSPFVLFFDRMALVDSMLAFFGVWTFVFAVITAKKLRLDTAMIAGFMLGGAFLTKSPAIYFALFLPFVLLLFKWPKAIKEKFNKLSVFVFLFSFTYLIAGAMYNILRLGPNFHMLSIRNLDYVYPLNHLLTTPLDPLLPFLDRTLEWLWILGPAALVVLMLLGIILNFNKHRREILLMIILGAAPTIISAEFAKVFTARYVLFTLPYLIILASSVFATGKYKLISNLILVAFVIQALYVDRLLIYDVEAAPLPRSERSGYLEEWTAGRGIREVAQYLREEYKKEPDDKIVVGTEGYFGTLPDGLQIYLNDIPEITVIGVGINIDQIPDNLKESAEAGNKTYLVINGSRLKADPEDLPLRLVEAYPKAFRQEGTREYNLLGPRDTLYLFEVTRFAE